MLQKKLKLTAVLLLGLCFTGLQAQTLFVKEKAGTQTSLTLNNIRKLSFAGGNLTVNKTDGSSGIYAISKHKCNQRNRLYSASGWSTYLRW
jgi:hypothetical protein